MEFVNSVITNTICEFAGTIVEHALYPFQVDNNITDLESATRDLVALKEDVKTSIEIAERQNGFRTNQAVEWLNKVDTIEKEVDEIQENNYKRRRSFWSNYTTSSSAVKKLRDLRSLCDQKATIEVTAHLPPPLSQEMPASSSKSPNLEFALHHIKDNVHNIIGIWGMGGVGKTHLLEQINNELSSDPAFKVVVFVTCFKECSEENVQNKIIDQLTLVRSDSMEQKQITIYNFLKERSFVVLLDDLWGRVDLKTIGIPDPMNAIGTCKRKVVLTTRSTEVCGQMEVKKKIKVDVLSWDDAWSLFKEKATEETIDSDPLIQKHAVAVVKELGGLPLALITIGRVMHDKMDAREWELAIMLLKQARLNDVEFSHVNQSVFHILKFSYDSLKTDALRQCFLHCSLWPEDYQFWKDDLVQFWIGLGLIDEPKIQAAYNVGYCYISRLQALCLLEVGNNDNAMKMHDVIRDMALWIMNSQGKYTNKWIVQAGAYQEQQEIEISGETEKLSIMMNFASKISISITCSFTKLSTLLLNNNSIEDSKTLRLELFSKLNFLDLSWNFLKAFSVKICKLVHLQFLNLSFNMTLKSLLPEKFGTLINLKYLHLRKTQCTFPNRVLSKLKALRVLDLYDCYVVENFHEFLVLQDDLLCLPHFEALGITISSMHNFHEFSQKVSVPIRWFNICNYKESCLSFSSCFLGNSSLQSNLNIINIGTMNIVEFVKFESTSETRKACHLERLENLFFQQMWNMKEVIWNGLDPKDVFPRLQYLLFGNCAELTSISWVIYLPSIRRLELVGCKSIKQLIRIDELKNRGLEVSQPSFPLLKIMSLDSNDELERISDTITFPALECLNVIRCNKLKKLPFELRNTPKKLRLIRGDEEWWNNIKMENGTDKSSVQPFFKKR
ncbi:hypothetical protein LUZ63_006271 [Rhynchospora breviuscula]|uniref:NB-ARC domain-containing protein n=1 Tax=Rhynchospora breviuscula TaxID=2022672 RepID=A0A9Q0CQL6_9POAL|nr:hypothetical protein LUZ63_006271 [Rhynchospora breviuscula]